MAEKNIIIVCGEASGDLNAGNLAKSMLQINDQIKIFGVGGAHLKSSGAEIFRSIEGLSVIGLFDVLRKLPRFLKLKRLILRKIDELKPAVIILVDFSGFNLRLAKAINKRIPVIYYTSPQVWASRQGRVEVIKKYVHKMIVFFEFEKEFYRRQQIEVDFVGHPLLDIVKPQADRKIFLSQLSLNESKPVIAMLPGSRPQEIRYILPVMLKAARLIKQQIPQAQFVIAKPTSLPKGIYELILKRFDLKPAIAEGKTYDCLNICDFCLVASGTATLETAIMRKPCAIIYKMSLLNYLLYRPQVKLPYIGMANIIAGKKIVPEFIQFHAAAKEIAAEALRILLNPQEALQIKDALSDAIKRLGEPGASQKAAKIILDYLNG